VLPTPRRSPPPPRRPPAPGWAALARRRGALPETFAGLPGAGELVATVAAGDSPERLAGELLAQGVPAAEIGGVLGAAAEAVESVPMLAAAARSAGVPAPALEELAALVQGRIAPEQWAATLTTTARSGDERSIRAA
jgi:glycerol-3-phosphate dehydrogenase (NAD(P)+)